MSCLVSFWGLQILRIIDKFGCTFYPVMRMFSSSAAHEGRSIPSALPLFFIIACFLSNVSSLLISLLTGKSQLSEGSLFCASHMRDDIISQLKVLPPVMVSAEECNNCSNDTMYHVSISDTGKILTI